MLEKVAMLISENEKLKKLKSNFEGGVFVARSDSVVKACHGEKNSIREKFRLNSRLRIVYKDK